MILTKPFSPGENGCPRGKRLGGWLALVASENHFPAGKTIGGSESLPYSTDLSDSTMFTRLSFQRMVKATTAENAIVITKDST